MMTTKLILWYTFMLLLTIKNDIIYILFTDKKIEFKYNTKKQVH